MKSKKQLVKSKNSYSKNENSIRLNKFLAKDKSGQLVFFADSAFTLQMTQSKYSNVKLHFVSEF